MNAARACMLIVPLFATTLIAGGAVTGRAQSAPTTPAYGATTARVPTGSIAVGGVGDSGVVYIVAADGSGVREIRSRARGAAGYPAFSPDGRQIAFTLVPAAGPGPRIELMSSTGANQRPFPGVPASSSQPVWSPNGGRLAFATATKDPFVADLYTVSTDGKGLKRIARNGAPGAWSADGREIVYTQGGDQRSQVYVVPAVGGRASLVADPGWEPTFAPNGDVAFTGSAGSNSRGVYLVSLKGGKPRLLLRNAFGAAWSPDGKFLAILRPVRCVGGLCHDRVLVTDAAAKTPLAAIGPELLNVQSRLSWGPAATPGR